MAKRQRWIIGERGPHPTDVHVGMQLRVRRTMLGLSQEELAGSIGLSFQQMQKNEKGKDRIGAGRLYELSQILDVPVGYFFEGLDDAQSNGNEALDTKRESLELIRAYYRIKSPKIRNELFELVVTAAEDEN